MTGTLIVVGRGPISFDTEAEETIKEAEAILELSAKRGGMMFDGTTKEPVGKDYDPFTQEKTIVVTPFAGG